MMPKYVTDKPTGGKLAKDHAMTDQPTNKGEELDVPVPGTGIAAGHSPEWSQGVIGHSNVLLRDGILVADFWNNGALDQCLAMLADRERLERENARLRGALEKVKNCGYGMKYPINEARSIAAQALAASEEKEKP